jgi:hypothetical protein
MPLLHRASLVVFADYHQFYLADGGTQWSAPVDWSDDDLQNGGKATDSVVAVAPARNMNVPVEVEVFDEVQAVELQEFDHVFSCSLLLPTGHLQLHECTGPERLYLSVPSGQYVVVVLFRGLAIISDDGLEGEDSYKVMLWPAAHQKFSVLKQWSGTWRG